MPLTLQNGQPQLSEFFGMFSLPILADMHTYMGRIITLILNLMKAITFGAQADAGSGAIIVSTVFYNDDGSIVDDATNLINGGSLIDIDDQATYQASITSKVALYASNHSYTVTDYIWAVAGATTSSLPRSFSNPSLAINTSRQPSTTRDTMVNATVDITTTLSLSGGSAGKVELKIADDTGFTTNVKTLQSYTNSNTGTLTIGLNTSQIGSASLTGIVPAGKYYRLVTTNVTGTPTYGTPVLQEVLL